ncbi:hypothetical protein DPMN_182613 [Dreissena polymorpha]|uniref:Uncharacterized protein n=1 Tax=Dreissena polymorpha TaxID=45954 RepID=A0A9D4DGU3_DREPO|nr:hypothetical protein DPMN_182613 [Dreissena polymorpha]
MPMDCPADVLWSLLRGGEPLPSSADLCGLNHCQVPRQEEDGDATTLVRRRRQRFPEHVAG